MLNSIQQAERNRRIYELAGVVSEYNSGTGGFTPAEEKIIGLIASDLEGGRILDIGVGAGRTVAPLLSFTQDYIGIDYSEPMIAQCRNRFPGLQFLCCDARQMESQIGGGFDFIFFSFNGIDCVNHEDRSQIFSQIFRMLEPGGLFLFSSHNLNVIPAKPWSAGLYKGGDASIGRLGLIRLMLFNTLNYARNAHLTQWKEDYAILLDIGHEFRCFHYYVRPNRQVETLRLQGFINVRAFGGGGKELVKAELRDAKSPHIHYLCQKPGPHHLAS